MKKSKNIKPELLLPETPLSFITEVWTEQTGGGVMVDYIRLNGKLNNIVIGIGNEILQLYIESSSGELLEIDEIGANLFLPDFNKEIDRMRDEDN